MHARDLVTAVTYDPDTTATAWLAETEGMFPRAISWPDFLVLCLQHRIAGLAHDTLRALGWYDQIPWTVYNELSYWSHDTEFRQAELRSALSELAVADPDAVSRAALLKGAALYPQYRKPSHRPMNDFDILFSADDFARIEPAFERLGYWKKNSLNGPTYYRKASAHPGKLCLDVHVCGPSKYYRPDSAISDSWLRASVPYNHFGVSCRRLSPEFEFVNVITHIQEHLGSWVHATDDDDIRLIRFIDLELLLATTAVDVAAAWSLATELDLHGEFALGLWAWAQVRRSLPAAVITLAPLVALVDDLGDLCAVPGGTLARWYLPLRDRAFLVDRGDRAFDLLPIDLQAPIAGRHWGEWHDWYMHRNAMTVSREKVETIAALARERVANFFVPRQ